MLITVLVLVIVIGKRLSKGCDNKRDYDYEHHFAEHEYDLKDYYILSLAPSRRGRRLLREIHNKNHSELVLGRKGRL